MSLKKHQSITTDTRATSAHMTNLLSHNIMNSQIQQSQNKQIQFLRIKNRQLKQRVQKLTKHIQQMESNKIVLMGLNEKYVKVVNEYYRNKSEQDTKQNSRSPPKGKSHKEVLHELEKDHRNLVKHCLVMEDQIKNYISEMNLFNKMKGQLREVNHTNPRQLIEEVRALTQQNKELKKQNNRITYELQKSKSICSKLKKHNDQQNERAEENGSELEKYKSFVNTIQQQCTDKSRAFEAKIYQLELKVEKLQKQLRRDQQFGVKNLQYRRKLQIDQVQKIYECDQLKKNLSFYVPQKKRQNYLRIGQKNGENWKATSFYK